MADEPNLKAAYDLSTDDDHRALYRDWAPGYDTNFARRRGYRLPELAASAFLSGMAPDFTDALDIGAGTGLVAAALPDPVRARFDALDLSAEMLAEAERQGLYRAYFAESLFDHAETARGRYDAVVSAGSFTIGHLGPDALAPALSYLRPGGLYVLTINQAHYRAEDFAAAFAALSDRVTAPTLTDEAIYTQKTGDGHDADRAFIATGTALT